MEIKKALIKSEGYDSRKSWFQTFDKDGRHAKVLAFYNCKDEEIGIKAIYNYKPDGSSDNSRSNEYIDYKPVAPETIGYLLLNVSCSDEPQLQLTGEWQGRIKNGMTPSEFSTKTFKLLKEKKKSTPNKNNGKGKI